MCAEEWLDATRMDVVTTVPADVGAAPFTGSTTSAVVMGSSPEVCFHIMAQNVILLRVHFWAKNFDRVVIQPYADDAGTTPITAEVSAQACFNNSA